MSKTGNLLKKVDKTFFNKDKRLLVCYNKLIEYRNLHQAKEDSDEGRNYKAAAAD